MLSFLLISVALASPCTVGAEDPVVPIGTMRGYAEGLAAQGIRVQVHIEPEGGHGWHPDAAEAIPAWFATSGSEP